MIVGYTTPVVAIIAATFQVNVSFVVSQSEFLCVRVGETVLYYKLHHRDARAHIPRYPSTWMCRYSCINCLYHNLILH